MRKKIELIPSGVSFVDNSWGGFYRGGTYMLLGPRKSGRTLLGLQFAMECVKQKEVCLYFTTMRPKDLMIQAASINFDLQNYMSQNLIIVVRVSPPVDFDEAENNDEFLAEYINDIVTVVEQYEPNKIVFDELTPFIGFRNTKLLHDTFLTTTESIEDSGITSLFILGDPATQAAKEIADILSANATGLLYLQKKGNGSGLAKGGKIILIPNIGHTEGQFKADYSIEPNKGITFRPEEEKSSVKSKKYKTLADLELPEIPSAFSNLYSYNDFLLILNNQIALFKSTGQIFTLLAFKINPEIGSDLLSITQLQNAVRLSTDKKDKICVVNQNVLVLVTKEDSNSVTAIFARVKSNLPGGENKRTTNIAEFVSVYSVKVDENTQNAEDLIRQAIINGSMEKNNAW